MESRRMRQAGHVARIGEMRNAYRILVWKPEWKRQLGRPRCGWEDNIKMDLGAIGLEDVDWVHLAQDIDWWQAVMNTKANVRFHKRQVIFE
jgi:hypothetical protein